MNKKAQKQIEVAKKKITNLQLQLSGAKQQPDDPADIPRLEKEIASLQAEITKLKSQE
jgi:peptidoglycan hydrolase CwlO-like protein